MKKLLQKECCKKMAAEAIKAMEMVAMAYSAAIDQRAVPAMTYRAACSIVRTIKRMARDQSAEIAEMLIHDRKVNLK